MDAFSMTNFFLTRLMGAENRDWMTSRIALRTAVISADLTMPGLLHVVGNIVGVWPLIVSYLMEIGKKRQ